MKKILFLLFFLISISASAETYYVKTGGSDAAAGTSDALAWETITKVNTVWAAGTFVPGDSILFKAGDTFYGTITVTESGTSGSPMYIGRYGTGVNPIITGFQILSSWTDAGGSIYYATLSSASDTTSTLTVDGLLTALGRYPNAGTNLTYESHSTSVSITDTGLGDATDWAGADAVINKNWYILERVHITDHTGDALTYKPYYSSSVSSVNDNRYYFIQNDLRTLDVTNEWWHDYANSRIYIFGNPAAKTVKAAALNYLIDLGTARDYITIENIRLEGSIRNAINIGSETGFFGNNDHIIIKNCQIEFAGINGISAWVSNVASAECVFEGNTIANTGSAAIFSRGNNIIITDNVISYAGIVPGMAFKGNDCQGIWAQGSTNPANYTIERNRITYTGHNGIGVYFQSAGSTSYNYIAYAMQKTDDGGGIYYGGISAHERIIDHNIVLYTGIGNPNGSYITRGIYMDSGADGAIITHNTVAHTLNSGLNFHSGDNNEVHDNILYDNGYQFTYPPAGIQIYEDSDFPSTTGNNISRNQFIAKLATQYAFTEMGYSAGEAAALGTFDNNYYARPIDNDNVIYYQGAEHTLASWQTFSFQDAASSQGTQTVTDTSEFYFIYNDSIGARTYTLSEPKIDIEGNKYAYSITLQAFESAVLFYDPAGIYSPTGLGWEDILSKRNFKDEVNFVQGIKINGVPVIVSNELSKLSGLTSTAGELNVLDGVDQTITAIEINTIKGATGNLQGQINAIEASTVDDSKADTSLSNLSSVAINTHLLPDTTETIDLGSSLKKFGNIFGTATNFTSVTTSTVTASGLVSTGAIRVGTDDTGSNVDSLKISGTTVGAWDEATQLSWDFPAADEGELGTYAKLITDTTGIFVFGAGSGAAADSTLFEMNDKNFGSFHNYTDTLYVVNFNVLYLTSGDSLRFNCYYGNRMTGTPTDSLFNAIQAVGTDENILTPNDRKIPPNSDVWIKMSGTQLTGKRPKQFEIQLNGYLIRDH
jgi:hypothetical protein